MKKKADREHEEQRVKDSLEKAQSIMGITGKYELSIVYDWGFEGDSGVDEEGATQVSTTTALTNANWEYMQAKIRYLMPIVCSSSDERLLAVTVHELVHVLLNPLDTAQILPSEDPRAVHINRLNEYTTECITRAILHAAGIEYPTLVD